MKSFFIFWIIVLSLIFIVGNTTLYGADIWTGSSVDKLMVNLEKKTEKLSIPERKIYYQNTIDTLEERIFQYRKLQEILRSRMDGMNSLLPWTITGAVIDKQDFWFIGRTWKLFEFQAKQCTILESKSTCASLLSINADQWRIFTLKNVTRGVTSKNLITQNSYHAIAGWDHPIYSFVDDNEVNANILQYGENKLDW